MNFLNKIFLIIFLMSFVQAQAQYYDSAPLSFKMPILGFSMDTVSYTISEVFDERENRFKLGDVYFGLANHLVFYYVKNGIPSTFKKYFDRGFAKTIKGDKLVTVAFKELSMNERKEDLGKKGGRLRHYRIVVDYLLNIENERYLVYTDSLVLDTVTKPSKYNIEHFCYSFFESSFSKLNQRIEFDSNFLTVIDSKINEDSIKDLNPNKAQDTLELKSDTVYVGQMKFKMNRKRVITTEGYLLPDHIQASINKEMLSKDFGEYVINYKVAEKDGNVVFQEIIPIGYKQSMVSPYWYITVPAIIILGIISGSSGG